MPKLSKTQKRALLLDKLQKNANLLAIYEQCFNWCIQTRSTLRGFDLEADKISTWSDKLDIMESITVLENVDNKSGFYLDYPPSFLPFTNLQRIKLTSETLDYIPIEGLEKCEKLVEYSINAPIQKINTDFSMLKKEFYLTFEGLKTAEIPSSLVENPLIYGLKIASDLKTVPKALSKLKVTHLNISYPFAAFPDFILQLPNLKHLTLTLSSIPSNLNNIGILKYLDTLQIQEFTWSTLPLWLLEIEALSLLRLECWRLREIPNWLLNCRIGSFEGWGYLLTEPQVEHFNDTVKSIPLKDRIKKGIVYSNFSDFGHSAQEIKNILLEDFDKNTNSKISALLAISTQRPLLAREQYELDILQKLQQAQTTDAVQQLQSEVENNPTDADLKAILLKRIAKKADLV